MSTLTKSQSAGVGVSDWRSKMTVKKIRFVGHGSNGSKQLRKYKQPRHAHAFVSAADSSDLRSRDGYSPASNRCYVIFVPKGMDEDTLMELDDSFAISEDAQQVAPVVIERGGDVISWRPGRAVVQCSPDRQDEIVRILADFAFYEGELRGLEAGIEARQAQAQEDVAIAYKISQRDKQEWRRVEQCAKYFAKMRLIYSRLEPLFTEPPRTLSLKSQSIVMALFRGADAEHRLSALNDRLEALEDLYEGATDRIADFGWYREGSMLEIIIIVLLVVETIIIAAEMMLHHH